MKILLYNPDNGVTRNFMPHLWMFLLQAITPPGHEVILIDANARAMSDDEIVQFIREQNIELVGIGAMTRMAEKAYRVADAIRSAGVKVVMGGPHVTEVPDEVLGRDGGPRHADAIALGEADETWPKIVMDAERNELKDIYAPIDESGKERKPSLQPYPEIAWESLDLDQFDFFPRVLRPLLSRIGPRWRTLRIIPIESGRGCPYGCEFCTVTGFFGDSIRFRSNQSIVDELLKLKARAKAEGGLISVFFVDDNFAISIKRTKSLLRAIIDANAQVPWTAQISANLLRDEELVDLIKKSGGRVIFIGMESIDPVNLADVKKGFNKPEEYAAVLNRLAERNIYAVTSFIIGLDNDTPGVADRILQQVRSWPPGLPVFGQLTPFPSTPLYKRLQDDGRLVRPKHWLKFERYSMAHVPLKMTIDETHRELHHAWASSYSPERNAEAVQALRHEHVGPKVFHFIMRLAFRAIYFPQTTRSAWLKVIFENRRTIFSLTKEALRGVRTSKRENRGKDTNRPASTAETKHRPLALDRNPVPVTQVTDQTRL
jgi:radical SAM superfamily enzyme YgiQ (UPF0313 family)